MMDRVADTSINGTVGGTVGGTAGGNAGGTAGGTRVFGHAKELCVNKMGHTMVPPSTGGNIKFLELFWSNCLQTVTYCAVFWSFGMCVAFLGPTLLDLACRMDSVLSTMSWIFFTQSLFTLIGSACGGFLIQRSPGTGWVWRVCISWVLYNMLYLLVQAGYGGYVFSYARRSIAGMTMNEAAYLNACFWGTFAFGRLMSIGLATRLAPAFMLLCNIEFVSIGPASVLISGVVMTLISFVVYLMLYLVAQTITRQSSEQSMLRRLRSLLLPQQTEAGDDTGLLKHHVKYYTRMRSNLSQSSLGEDAEDTPTQHQDSSPVLL
nr:uncharacterized protein LOC128704746 [Cherax quadricarinatus]